MATIIYSTGNGYNCHCCRRTTTEYLDFVDVEDAIHQCIEIAKYADWDFSIDAIKGWDNDEQDEWALEKLIEGKIAEAEKVHKNQKEIDSLNRQIREIDGWFNSLEDEKVRKADVRKKLSTKLAELGG